MPEKQRVKESVERHRNSFLERTPFTTTNWLRERKRSKEIHKQSMRFTKPTAQTPTTILRPESTVGRPQWKEERKHKWMTKEGFLNATSSSFVGKQTKQAWDASNLTLLHNRYEGGYQETGNAHLQRNDISKEVGYMLSRIRSRHSDSTHRLILMCWGSQ